MCVRELDGQAVEFGTSGYTKDDVFVLYDRRSNSLWWPRSDGAFDAVSGPEKGEALEFLDKPSVMPLGRWVKDHPETLVLLPAPEEATRSTTVRPADRERVAGTWNMNTEFGGGLVPATLKLAWTNGEFQGTWQSQGQEMPVTGLEVDGPDVSFQRPMGAGRLLTFEGKLDGEKLEGHFKMGGRKLPCRGERIGR